MVKKRFGLTRRRGARREFSGQCMKSIKQGIAIREKELKSQNLFMTIIEMFKE